MFDNGILVYKYSLSMMHVVNTSNLPLEDILVLCLDIKI